MWTRDPQGPSRLPHAASKALRQWATRLGMCGVDQGWWTGVEEDLLGVGLDAQQCKTVGVYMVCCAGIRLQDRNHTVNKVVKTI